MGNAVETTKKKRNFHHNPHPNLHQPNDARSVQQSSQNHMKLSSNQSPNIRHILPRPLRRQFSSTSTMTSPSHHSLPLPRSHRQCSMRHRPLRHGAVLPLLRQPNIFTKAQRKNRDGTMQTQLSRNNNQL